MLNKKPQLHDDSEVDMTPMLDIVFIMLIFFIVTTSFTKVSGVSLSRPAPIPDSKPVEATNIIFTIDQNDRIYLAGQEIDFRALNAVIEREKANNIHSKVIVNVNAEASNNTMILVVDAARKAGIENVNAVTDLTALR